MQDGRDYQFSVTALFKWCPRFFIVNLEDTDMSRVVRSKDGCSRGIVSAAASKIANAPDAGPHYDHKRHHAETCGAASWQFEGKPESDHGIWDFVFFRDDGTSFWLHPNFTDNKVECGKCSDAASVQPPPSGRGGSGKGQVFKSFKNARKVADLKLGKNKNELRGATRASALALALARGS